MLGAPTVLAAVLRRAPRLALWYDFTTGTFQDTALTTAASADADPIGGLVDQTGNAVATQGTAGSRPLLKLSIQNGKSVGRFDGTDDFLTFSSLLLGDFSVFVVGVATSALSGDRILLGHASAATHYLGDFYQDNLIYFFESGSSVATSTSAFVADTWALWEFHRTGPVLTVYKNAAQVGTVLHFSGQVFLGQLGARNGLLTWKGDLGEVRVYDKEVTEALKANERTYLNGKWALY